ncbi:iron-sulfur cluster assembly protein [Ramlibacter sp.]|uniref:iron-sulfur cluster assembly protein n=1 Tax=Ramlibacter sp. TaxID=1917967 RepID=UPI002D2D85AE|nr:iron-sulfur cluster assembly protein [Ramlibacter sp.]HYD77673.1 iron-sulfur cluster assembly protein [Ramlibacter sp.]
MLFAYEGPAGDLPAVQRALAAVTDPLEGGNLLQRRAVRHATLRNGRARVVLELAPGLLRQVMVEDLEAELFDHLEGRWYVEVLVVDPPEARQRRAALG